MSEYFIPVAVNKTEVVQSRRASTQHAAENAVVHLLTNGRAVDLAVFLTTADGQQLTDKQIFRMQSAREVEATLWEALARFGSVRPRHVRPVRQDPDRGVGGRPDGSVRLAVVIRYTDSGDYTARPVYDSIILSGPQWQALVPSTRQKGARYSVPDPVARQFSRIVGASPDPTTMLRAEDLSAAGMTGTVTRADARETTVALAGRFAGLRHHVNGGDLPGQAVLEGELVLAPDGRPLRLLIVSEGAFKTPWDRQPRSTGAVVDWQAGPRRAQPKSIPHRSAPPAGSQAAQWFRRPGR